LLWFSGLDDLLSVRSGDFFDDSPGTPGGSGSKPKSSSAAESGFPSASGRDSPIRTSLEVPPLLKTALSWTIDSTLFPLHSSPAFRNFGSLKSLWEASFRSSTMTWCARDPESRKMPVTTGGFGRTGGGGGVFDPVFVDFGGRLEAERGAKMLLSR